MSTSIEYAPVKTGRFLDNATSDGWNALCEGLGRAHATEITLSDEDLTMLRWMHIAKGTTNSIFGQLYDAIEKHGEIIVKVRYC